ncbi:hypothetical protein OBBRIDRAFT_791525 [Obba rivulosa]|uniref:Uncharacterized protein n=1 Tax=Obba rivulosa TaxID=1052685 RepID=A0A8E2AW55_9APHY|nr:hypothetical protein OBBRIDRAFT_791525 [Obba rivulosa]
MRHSGVLLELPLEQFLPNPNATAAASKRMNNKRPHSPGAPSQYSPTKRRILHEEGIFTPETTTKSPQLSESGRFAPSHFNKLLSGPGSPARKLEFGVSSTRRLDIDDAFNIEHRHNDITPKQSAPSAPSSPMKLAPSPELAAKRSGKPLFSRSSVEEFGMDVYHSPRKQSVSSTEFPSALPRSFLPTNRQSHHYPGFDVYQDSHGTAIDLLSSSVDAETSLLGSPPQRVRRDKESEKENMPPRRKSMKSIAIPLAPPAWEKAGLLSPHTTRTFVEDISEPMQMTPQPKKIHSGLVMGRGLDMTPASKKLRMHSPGDDRMLITRRTPVGRDERRQRRQVLEDEVDAIGDVDSDEDMMI